MNYACPHCHELLTSEPASGLPPAMCARCGGDLQLAPAAAEPSVPTATAATTAPAARSFASFLRWNRSATKVPATAGASGELTLSEPDGKATDAQTVATAGASSAHANDESTVPGADLDDNTLDSAAPVAVEATPAADPAPATAADSAGISAPVHAMEEAESAHVVVNPDQIDPLHAWPSVDTSASPPAAPASPPAEAATPSFTMARGHSTSAPRTVAWQWVALVVLALALMLQVLLADRARLATDAQWRPLLTSLCSALRCALPAWHEPDAFTMLSRDVRPAPDTPGALQVQATFRNDARWNQRWPVMRLSLSDADGRVVGARAFIASEYLGPTVTQATLAPGQSAQVMLQVREPPAGVVAFAFDFD